MRIITLTLLMATVGCHQPGVGQETTLDITYKIPDVTGQTVTRSVPMNKRDENGVDTYIGMTEDDPTVALAEHLDLTFGEASQVASTLSGLPPMVVLDGVRYVSLPYSVDSDNTRARHEEGHTDTGSGAPTGTITAEVYGTPLAEGAWTCQDQTVSDGELPQETADVSYPDAGTIVFSHFGIGTLAIVDTHMVRASDGTSEVIGDFTFRNSNPQVLATINIGYSDGQEYDLFFCWAGLSADEPD